MAARLVLSGPCSFARRGGRLFALLAWVMVGLAAQDWSGTITVVESIVGSGNVGGADKTELEDYVKQLKARLQKAQLEMRTAAPLVARTLREDIGSYEAELERVVLARGDPVTVGSSTFTISGARMLVLGEGPRMVIDRTRNEAAVLVAGKSEILPLAPLPAPRDIDKSATDVQELGIATKKFTVRAEGKVCTVLLAPGLPNPYAIGLLPSTVEDKETLPLVLATLPGLPVLVEYKSDEITHRWVVTAIEAKAVAEAVFGE